MSLTVSAINGLKGELSLPGDKSISHRAAMLGAIADGKTLIHGFLSTGDCLSTVRVMAALGARFEGIGSDNITVYGAGLNGLKEPADVLDAGNSATTARLVSGLLAGQKFFSAISGDESLRGRPMRRITEPLGLMGANISGRDKGNRLPLAISGAALTGIEYSTPVPSAQIKSAILIAGLYAAGKTVVTEAQLTRDHTERMLSVMGADVRAENDRVVLTGGSRLSAAEIFVPSDVSSAAFFVAAGILTPGTRLKLKNVGMNSARIGILDAFKAMGAAVTYDKMTIKNKEPRADIIVEPGALTGITVEADTIPRLIDEVPVLAVAATQAEGKTTIKGAAELRVKESDRLKAMAANLTAMGANIKETGDGLVIKGPTRLKGTGVVSYGDHRIAMAMIVAGLIADGETVIDDGACIDISFPDFERTLKSVAV